MIMYLPFFLMGAPLVFAILDLMRTPRTHADRHHTTLAGNTAAR